MLKTVSPAKRQASVTSHLKWMTQTPTTRYQPSYFRSGLRSKLLNEVNIQKLQLLEGFTLSKHGLHAETNYMRIKL
jgi:hypothetical protein